MDRSLGGRLLIARLRDAGWDARTLAEEYGDAEAQAMSDDEWIASGTASGFVLLAKDHRIASRPLEALAIYIHDARAIAFANGNLTATQMGDLC
ncbi:PIN-like domain-containing protein [Microbacterium arabinogalactanolyticum]|uniref:PIN-like domain-containing protein n=1 Tax=Microbacterium arabinogalactanolyticum TaxID=69365 RepID=UPI0040444240